MPRDMFPVSFSWPLSSTVPLFFSIAHVFGCWTVLLRTNCLCRYHDYYPHYVYFCKHQYIFIFDYMYVRNYNLYYYCIYVQWIHISYSIFACIYNYIYIYYIYTYIYSIYKYIIYTYIFTYQLVPWYPQRLSDKHFEGAAGGDSGRLEDHLPGEKNRDGFAWKDRVATHVWLGGGFKYFLFSPLFGEDFPFD